MKRRRRFAVVPLALGMLGMAATALAAEGPIRLLKDVNPTLADDRSSYPDTFRKFGGLTLFRAWTHGQGGELWRTDGTEGGTFLLKDIFPGPSSSLNWDSGAGDPGLVEVGGVFLFLANDGVHGFELWKTDGTGAGTAVLKDIQSGGGSAFTSFFSRDYGELYWHSARCGGLVYFLADDGGHGFQLWRTDGTSPGTFLVLRDGGPGSANVFNWLDSLSLEGVCMGTVLQFRAATAAYGSELWRTDGTPEGTSLLRDINPGAGSSYPTGFTAFRGGIVFSATTNAAGSELWKSDGTMFGTVQVKDIFPGPSGSGPGRFTVAGDLLFFEIFQYLYRTDGTSAGTILLHTFRTGSIDFYGDLNGRLLFRADDGDHGFEPWMSDGTTFGTVLLKDTSPGPGSAFSFSPVIHVPGAVYFWTNDGAHGVEPWRSDGTPGGTGMLADLTPGPGDSQAYSAVPWKGGVLFSTQDALWVHAPGEREVHRVSRGSGVGEMFAMETQILFARDDGGTAGRELWRTDGTGPGTRMLKDLESLVRTGDSYPRFLGKATRPDGRETALFIAWNGGESGLWASDGTSRGTALLARVGDNEYSEAAALNGLLYFGARDAEHGYELWRSDGTLEGTRLAVELYPGEWGGLLMGPVALRDRLYFVAETDDTGFKLWSSDGTPEGSAPLGWDTPADFFPRRFIVAGDRLYFDAYHPDYGNELFTSDGTAAGTRLVRDIGRNGGSGCCGAWFDFHGRLLFMADDGDHGLEPWITDGMEEGTFLLKDIYPGRQSSTIIDPQPGGPYVHFAASDAAHGRELWRTDGTEEGTVLVKDIRPGTGSSFPNLMGDAGGSLLFVARDPSGRANDLWRSDGSEAGTALAKHGCEPRTATGFDGVMLFSDSDDDHGYELWRSDGTAAGTVLVQDLAPGPDGSYPDRYFRAGTSLLLMADGLEAAFEPFGGRTAIVLGRPLQAVRDLQQEVAGIGGPRGIATSLNAKLDSVTQALSAGRKVEAIFHLETFLRHVDVLSHPIGEEVAGELTTFAQDLLRLLQQEDAPTAPAPKALRQRPEP